MQSKSRKTAYTESILQGMFNAEQAKAQMD